jgi:predicted nucleotidyltransferase
MRLDEQQTRTIKTLVVREFEPDARVWLFGSRVDETRRGGDVDLYVETSHPELMRELRCKMEIEEAIDLHVDLIVAKPGDARPIAHIAKKEGILL